MKKEIKKIKIKIKVHTNSKKEKIKKINYDYFEVWIKEKPIEGKANIYLERFLKNYFKKNVKIISGFKSRKKIVEI